MMLVCDSEMVVCHSEFNSESSFEEILLYFNKKINNIKTSIIFIYF